MILPSQHNKIAGKLLMSLTKLLGTTWEKHDNKTCKFDPKLYHQVLFQTNLRI